MFKKCGSLLLILFCLFLTIGEVKAADSMTVTVGEPYYYYTVQGNDYGEYAGKTKTAEATKYTRLKYIGSMDYPVYCVQSESRSPANGAQYYKVAINSTVQGQYWDEEAALQAGCIIDTVNDNVSPDEAEYVANYATLNSFFKFDGRIDFKAYNHDIDVIVRYAMGEYCYNNVKITTSLPNFNVTAVNSTMTVHNSGSNTYYTGAFKISNASDSYGGDAINYTISLPSGVELCSDNKCTKKNSKLSYSKKELDSVGTFYVKAPASAVGGDISVTVKATNSSEYSIADLWTPATGNTQLLIGHGGKKKYDRKRNKVVTFDVPDVSKKTIKLVKKDSSTGGFLKGANLTLQLSGGSNNSCTIKDGSYSCTITIEENSTSDTFYSVIENSSPSGYIKGTAIKNNKWNINEKNTICYAGDVETDIEDCNRNYVRGAACTKDNGASYTLGECPLIEVDNSTGDNNDDSTSEGDEENVDDTVDENVDQTPQYDGVTEQICYYSTNNGIVKVDNSKCDAQYMKVTNSSGNLVVEYYNHKNQLEISKYAISGDQELSGADLKICSNKPDDKGNCTVVKNIFEGQCIDGNNSEFNCVNNDDGTKTVDMHWISGASSKIWNGIPKGTYYLVETVSPKGFLPLTSYIEFSVDEDGNVTSDSYDKDAKKLIVRNKPTSFKVLKKDASDGKNLKGATLAICNAVKDENGNYKLLVGDDGFCVPAVLSNGDSATWTTDDKAKSISGLGLGDYYLVEILAPENYAVSDAIFFSLRSDGTIADINGKVFKNNELVMNDQRIISVETGELPILKIVLIGIIAVLLCGFSYYYLVKKNGFEIIKNKFKKNK